MALLLGLAGLEEPCLDGETKVKEECWAGGGETGLKGKGRAGVVEAGLKVEGWAGG